VMGQGAPADLLADVFRPGSAASCLRSWSLCSFRTSPFIEPLSAARTFHEMIGLGFGDAIRRRLAEVVVLSSRAA
jgi:hypothetical protein